MYVEDGFSVVLLLLFTTMMDMFGAQPTGGDLKQDVPPALHDPTSLHGISLMDMIDSDMKEEFDDIIKNEDFHSFPISLETLEALPGLESTKPNTVTSQHLSYTTPNGLPGSPVDWNNMNSVTNHQQSDYFINSFNSNYFDEINAQTLVNPNSVMPMPPQQLSPHSPVSTPTQQQQLSVSTQFEAVRSPLAHSPAAAAATNNSGQYGSIQLGVYSQQQNGSSGPIRKTLKVLPPVSSPLQRVPSPTTNTSNTSRKKNHVQQEQKENGYPKPAYSYSCLIALALKNSQSGHMSVSEIYKFMCDHFPYFKTAPSGWKNSVRHNLSLNKCFEKIEKPSANGTNQRKGCLWAMNPAKIQKMDEEVRKWSNKDPMAIKKGMALPDTLESLERGEMVRDYNQNNTGTSPGSQSEDEEDPRTPTSVSSQGSQGYDSAGSDFVDIEGFASNIGQDSSLNELNIQASGGIYEELGEDRLTLNGAGTPTSNTAEVNLFTAASDHSFYPTIHGNYHIAPASEAAKNSGAPTTGRIIIQKQDGKKYYSVP